MEWYWRTLTSGGMSKLSAPAVTSRALTRADCGPLANWSVLLGASSGLRRISRSELGGGGRGQGDLEVRVRGDEEVVEAQGVGTGGQPVDGDGSLADLIDPVEVALGHHRRAGGGHRRQRGLVEGDVDLLVDLEGPRPVGGHLQRHRALVHAVADVVARAAAVHERSGAGAGDHGEMAGLARPRGPELERRRVDGEGRGRGRSRALQGGDALPP